MSFFQADDTLLAGDYKALQSKMDGLFLTSSTLDILVVQNLGKVQDFKDPSKKLRNKLKIKGASKSHEIFSLRQLHTPPTNIRNHHHQHHQHHHDHNDHHHDSQLPEYYTSPRQPLSLPTTTKPAIACSAVKSHQADVCLSLKLRYDFFTTAKTKERHVVLLPPLSTSQLAGIFSCRHRPLLLCSRKCGPFLSTFTSGELS